MHILLTFHTGFEIIKDIVEVIITVDSGLKYKNLILRRILYVNKSVLSHF